MNILSATCQLSLIPMRKEPMETSEQISQVIFGETFDILEQRKSWLFIRLHFDAYEGWISQKRADMFSEPLRYPESSKVILKDALGRIVLPGKNPEYIYLPGGAELIKENTGFLNGPIFFTFDPVCMLHETQMAIDLTGTALKYMNAPYLWGGRTIFGIDCSGFTQIVYKMNSINLPRDANQQAKLGKTINSPEEAEAGDLAFFENNGGTIIHTGMFLDKSTIIHASDKVRTDKIDLKGIYNNKLNSHTHKLKIIKRYIL